MKKWFNIELSLKNAELLREKLLDKNIKFETSAAGNLIHFETLMEPESEEFYEIDNFCCNLPYFNA